MTAALIGLAVALWVAWNVAAPYATLRGAARISPGRLPRELFTGAAARRVRFYVAELRGGYGYSLWAPPAMNLVVFDRAFFDRAGMDLLRFVIAHELAHFARGHHRRRWLLVTCGLAATRWGRERLMRYEREADAEATQRTGFVRANFTALSPLAPA